ncbi:hypothetical protein Tel_13040 [Candidatus Tenderia electrophaga]|jgi:hypothetical protein|uniref:Peptidase M41 domain-containing protein n=1 Tax=Candidatus Tenderia electrophaga TaxID=1748243 RepID=A0A0S2TFV4_9GAMM|nr:hypothetical protein Tel_13040 [Candidatus Tenderia electrophaga]
MRVEDRPPYRWLRRVGAIADLPSWPRDRRTLAYHEAGHAVLSELCGLAVDVAKINTEGSKGEMRFVKPRPCADVPEFPQAMIEKVAVEMAAMYVGGVMCELLLHGRDLKPGTYLLLNDRDWTNAKRILWKAFSSHTPLFYCQRLARAVLSENWTWVRAVAAEIEAVGIADGATVRRLRGESAQGIPADGAEQSLRIRAPRAAGAGVGAEGLGQCQSL